MHELKDHGGRTREALTTRRDGGSGPSRCPSKKVGGAILRGQKKNALRYLLKAHTPRPNYYQPLRATPRVWGQVGGARSPFPKLNPARKGRSLKSARGSPKSRAGRNLALFTRAPSGSGFPLPPTPPSEAHTRRADPTGNGGARPRPRSHYH